MKKQNTPKTFSFRFNIFWMYAIIGAILIGIWYSKDSGVEKIVPWSEFEEKYIYTKGVTEITVITQKHEVEAKITDNSARENFKDVKLPAKNPAKNVVVRSVYHTDNDLSESIKNWNSTGVFRGEIKYDHSGGFMNYLWSFGPLVILIVFWIWMMRRMTRGDGGAGGGVFSVGKSKAQLFDKDNSTRVTFKDVAGLQEAKTEVEEIVEFLKNPKRYTELGGKIPKGALLVGPPGTGKTLLAKAVAGEANVPFFSLSGSDFVEMFVGVGASRVRDLFKKAKDKAPCIIFIDEIDAVGRARGRNPNMGSNDERENTLNQLLTEMDGFGTNSGIIVLAATNRADILDKALLRAGRFDRQIYVDLPDLNDRKAIFNVHLRGVKTSPDVNVDLLARQTPGFSGADIANVCNEAALIAARAGKKSVEPQDFMNAVDRIIGGLEKRSKITTREERESIACHEAGHATISWHLQYANPLIKVTIVPRGKALGAAWYLPEERQITPRQAILDEICSLLGGRAAEELFTGHISTGALNDLERATKQAYTYVAFYGMSESLPNVCYYDSTGQDYGFTKPYSEARAQVIDSEVSRLINEQYERAKELLRTHAEGHNRLRDILLDREVIFTEDVENIFGKRPWTSRADEIIKTNESATDNNDNADNSNENSSTDDKSESDGSEAKPDSGETPPPVTPDVLEK
ncbi:MAG: ATP-dependent zinc metalloprotease FtsH [Bacteroidales bacterium]|nr:ATP-dependent zinc metalloprotease FtsH [Bacteroidales bacterium]MDY4942561.1 ATP-dependent zinc metalloprotease FtsH [Candidatus Limisoma sp.]MDY5900955.1 ATP-dependent zinc metalloprotease FtsH [Candidatus Limisoma sp.]